MTNERPHITDEVQNAARNRFLSQIQRDPKSGSYHLEISLEGLTPENSERIMSIISQSPLKCTFGYSSAESALKKQPSIVILHSEIYSDFYKLF